MENWFLTHNRHLENPEHFSKVDPDLLRLKEQSLIYPFPLLEKFPEEVTGIFALHGAHQTGKTTLLKLWIEKLLAKSIPANAIAFFSGEEIANHAALYQSLKKQIISMEKNRVLYILIDNVTDINRFEKALAKLQDEGLLDFVLLMLSSIDSSIENVQLKNVFHLHPLSFRETVLLKLEDSEPTTNTLYKAFDEYLLHGGLPGIINEFVTHEKISDKSLIAYGDKICQETEKSGKQERFLREILKATFRHYNNQITWNAVAPELSIDHTKTIGDYFAWLEAIDVIFIQYALLEESLSGAPKKARKIMFADPFYFHAMNAWLNPGKNYYDSLMKNHFEDVMLHSNLVKSCVIGHFKRFFPTYYIKGEGEIDLAYVNAERFWPIETTWTSQLRAKDLKQILKYPNGRILTKTERSGIIQHIQTEPLPLALWQLDDSILP
jgi:uncharacterized protein